jgi:hypothetical protein
MRKLNLKQCCSTRAKTLAPFAGELANDIPRPPHRFRFPCIDA